MDESVFDLFKMTSVIDFNEYLIDYVETTDIIYKILLKVFIGIVV